MFNLSLKLHWNNMSASCDITKNKIKYIIATKLHSNLFSVLACVSLKSCCYELFEFTTLVFWLVILDLFTSQVR